MDEKNINLLKDNPISLRDICKDVLVSILASEITALLHFGIATAIEIIIISISR
mgnify:CR=1 FL=1